MATTKKSAAPAAAPAPVKTAPAVSAKPAAKPVEAAKPAVAKPVVPKAAAPKPVTPKAAVAPVAKKALAKAVTKAAPKPAAEKAAVPAAKAKAPAKKVAPAVKPIDPGQRANYIEVAAFYIAERRGFTPGNPEQDYLDAAAEIDRLIAAGHFGK